MVGEYPIRSTLMYGKLFSSMYEGSMVGAGAVVFAVMGYVISKQKPPEFTVELNPKLLAAILGETPEEIQKAIDYLEAPDPISRTDRKEGKRLEKVGSFNYHVVNGDIYHNIRNYEERKAYNREAQRKFREKNQKPVLPPPGVNTATGTTPPSDPVKDEPSTPPKPKPSVVIIPENLSGDDFSTAWSEWCADRKERKKTMTQRAMEMQLKELSVMGKARAIEAIRNSIRSGYQGLFEPNGKAFPSNQPLKRPGKIAV